MDWTPLEHVAIAVGLQLAVGMRLRNWWLGGMLGCCWFLAREHTQAEYRWIAQFGAGLRANLPWWGGFDASAWDLGSMMDWMAPALACTAVWALLRKRRPAPP